MTDRTKQLPRFELFTTNPAYGDRSNKEWGWRLYNNRGFFLASSCATYMRREGAMRDLNAFRSNVECAVIVDLNREKLKDMKGGDK